MIDRFIQHIRTKNLLDQKKRYLLGISGGIDSVCLGHLLKAADIDFDLAHVNFGLRGSESDEDELFVQNLAVQWQVEIHVHRPATTPGAGPGLSVQMEARELRYTWFESLCKEKKYEGVIVAHHFEDQLETVLLNLLRTTGIEGVYGMAERKGRVFRPLLSFRRAELLDFMANHQYQWREDSSNAKLTYKRNFIRHALLPVIQEGFPHGAEALDQSFGRLKETGKAFFHLYDQWKSEVIKEDSGYQSILVDQIKNVPGKTIFIYYWLRDYGFGYPAIQDLVQALDKGVSGKKFFGSGFTLNLDRYKLILGKTSEVQLPFSLSEYDIEAKFEAGVYEILKLKSPHSLDRNPLNAMLDLQKLEFPLEVRPWQEGDKLIPLGMKSPKKVSDLLIDNKIPLIQKEKTQVLCSGGKIVWVIGIRISEKFKCDDSTRQTIYFKRNLP
jgi:tRNA(Ile)-lysidine synthase